MQASLTDRARWPWWLAAALVAVSIAMWWRPWAGNAVVPVPVPVPAPAPAIARHMPAPEPSRPALVVAPAPALQLVGTTVGGAGSFATVRRRTDSQILLLRVGDRVDGLAVTAIEPDRIVLAGAAQPIVIEVDRTAAAPAPPVPSRAVSPPPAPKAESPAWAEGEAPWDAGPNFRH
ncbi:MAG: hypothetical protein QM750_21680 [Rubrivivax sp.]